MRVAVVGHVEWIEFARVERVPRAGEIVHAIEAWEEPGGGGAVAAVQLARLAGEVTFLTALSEDDLGQRAKAELEHRGVRVEAAQREESQRRAFTYVDAQGERTITVIGDRLGPRAEDALPWGDLAAMDAVYFTAGDAPALRAARAASVLVATPRGLETIVESGVELDALVGSGSDAGERYDLDALEPRPRLAVATAGAEGGRWTAAGGETGEFAATPLSGAVTDAYGAGDCFAAGLTFALGERRPLPDSLELAARCGAAALTGRGPYAGQLEASDVTAGA